MKITTMVEIPPRRIADLMVVAIESSCGINYWCKSVHLLVPNEEDASASSPTKGCWYDNDAIYDDPGLKIIVKELESSQNDRDGRWHLDLPKMERAFYLMQEFGTPKGWHWQDFLNENEDATTADVWFQLAVFGEVVYG